MIHGLEQVFVHERRLIGVKNGVTEQLPSQTQVTRVFDGHRLNVVLAVRMNIELKESRQSFD